MGVQNMSEFRQKVLRPKSWAVWSLLMTQVGRALPSVPRSPPKPGERTEFSGINDFLHYIIERDEVERREKRKQQQSNIEKPPWRLLCDFDQQNFRSFCAIILSFTEMLVNYVYRWQQRFRLVWVRLGKRRKSSLLKGIHLCSWTLSWTNSCQLQVEALWSFKNWGPVEGGKFTDRNSEIFQEQAKQQKEEKEKRGTTGES